jgi:hypothetical protein
MVESGIAGAIKLALCLKHIMKMPEFTVLQEVDSVLIGLWKVFEYSPKKFCIFKEVQTTYGNRSLKLIRAVTTRSICMKLI